MHDGRKKIFVQVGFLLILLLSLTLRVAYTQKNAFDYDEGHWLMFAMLTVQGYEPYTEIFVGIPPLALLTIQLGALLFGSDLTVRIPMLLYSLVGVAAIFWLVKQQTDRYPGLAGLLAAMFLSFNYQYFTQSTTIMGEVPAVALALLSVALVEYYRKKSSYLWLALSGAVFAASVLLKVFVVFLPLIIAIQILTSDNNSIQSLKKLENIREIIKRGAIWLGGLLAPFIFFLFIYDAGGMYHQVVEFRMLLRDEYAESRAFPFSLYVMRQEIFKYYMPLTIGAVLGVIFVGYRDFRKIWLWLLWLFLAGLMLLLHVPLRARYAVVLLPPLAALSSIAVTYAISYLGRYSFIKRNELWVLVSTYGLFLGLTLINPVITTFSSPENHSFDQRYAGRLAAADFVKRITAPDECIVVDDQRFAYIAERLVPPFLSETTDARFRAGWLTDDQILDIANQSNCQVLISVSDRFYIRIPALQDKATLLYSLKMVFGDGSAGKRNTVIYAIKMDTEQPPSQVINSLINNSVLLKGVDITPSPWYPGQSITISTYWQAQQKLDQDYKIFIDIKNSQGQSVAVFDHYPFESSQDDLVLSVFPSPSYWAGHAIEEFSDYPSTGLIPTRLWIPGNTLKETITKTLPDDMPASTYTISIGLVDESTGERLPVGHGSDENEIVVSTVEIEAK